MQLIVFFSGKVFTMIHIEFVGNNITYCMFTCSAYHTPFRNSDYTRTILSIKTKYKIKMFNTYIKYLVNLPSYIFYHYIGIQ